MFENLEKYFCGFTLFTVLSFSIYINFMPYEDFNYKNIDIIRIQSFPLFLVASILYLPVIFIVKKYYIPKGDKELLKECNIYWNLFLSILSGNGFLQLFYHFLYNNYDCSIINGSTGKWITIFCLSKIPELLDTFFIIMRGKPLIILQWFHHFATLLLCWLGLYCYGLQIFDAALINYGIHFIMYMYFLLYDLGFKNLKKYNKVITVLQLTQMIYMTIRILTKYDGLACHFYNNDINYIAGVVASLLYGIYIILFGMLLVH